MATKARLKGHAIVKRNWKEDIPKFDKGEYNSSVIKVLTYFRNEVSDKQHAKIATDYMTENKLLKKNDVVTFGVDQAAQLAALGYMYANGLLNAGHKKVYKEKVASVIQPKVRKTKTKVTNEEKVKKPSVRDFILASARVKMADVDSILDDVWADRKVARGRGAGKMPADVKQLIDTIDVSGPVAKVMAAMYKPVQKEMETVCAYKDEQLDEAYEHVSDAHARKYLATVNAVIERLEHIDARAKVQRKPRRRKEKPAAVIAAKVKFLKEDKKLKIASITPDKVIGNTIAWVYNTKLRRMTKYVAVDGSTLTWKGTTLQNIDPTQCFIRTLRDPAKFFKGAEKLSKPQFNNALKDMRENKAKITGRMNADSVIYRVY
jgi:hypothetical protein